MKISRSLFLALTGAIGATTACYVDTNPNPPPPPPRPVAYPYQYPPGAYPAQPRPVGTTYYYVNANGQRVARRVVYRRRLAPVGKVTADPAYQAPPPMVTGVVPGPSTEGTAAGNPPPPQATPTPTPAAPTEAQGCLDSTAMAVPDCSSLKFEPSCGIKPFVMEKCKTYRDYLDPSVATVAVSCMESLSSKQLCDASNTYNCGKQALSEACPDNELAQLCTIAATSCKTTASDCTALLSGLNDTAKQAVARCIATGCHAGLYSCVEGLSSSGEGGKH
jgi:hypothetical protein